MQLNKSVVIVLTCLAVGIQAGAAAKGGSTKGLTKGSMPDVGSPVDGTSGPGQPAGGHDGGDIDEVTGKPPRGAGGEGAYGPDGSGGVGRGESFFSPTNSIIRLSDVARNSGEMPEPPTDGLGNKPRNPGRQGNTSPDYSPGGDRGSESPGWTGPDGERYPDGVLIRESDAALKNREHLSHLWFGVNGNIQIEALAEVMEKAQKNFGSFAAAGTIATGAVIIANFKWTRQAARSAGQEVRSFLRPLMRRAKYGAVAVVAIAGVGVEAAFAKEPGSYGVCENLSPEAVAAYLKMSDAEAIELIDARRGVEPVLGACFNYLSDRLEKLK